ncbi:hypothetical protein [Mycolicibacterium palauense]|uniref:hypothetical protein n=1 Tax=Mycolicibacterium palauense TaxID=2034511 RepID=UPI000BFF16AF|nr:hypothetical protein [Mycolicibacterium palauense]
MRVAAILSAALGAALAVAGPAAGPAGAAPEAPDLGDYREAPVGPFLDGATNGGEVYFQTPDGLLCGIRPAQGRAGCDGALPGTTTGANEIVMSADPAARGLRITPTPQFVKPTGRAAPVLAAGDKILFEDFACATGEDALTLCTQGTPAAQWMVIGPEGTAVGPATPGLPSGFPDPNDFVVGDQSYLVGIGPKNLFPVFTTSGGLQCKIQMSRGGEIGCDGPLPGVENGDDEVFAQFPGAVGTRRAGHPPFSTPAYPGPILELPAGHRIDSFGATCMATDDGGVACFGMVDGKAQGFRVSAEDTATF